MFVVDRGDSCDPWWSPAAGGGSGAPLFAGQPITTVTEVNYLGITFHSTTNMTGATGPAHTQLGRLALTRARCAELGVEAAPVQLRLLSMMVDSVLSHGVEGAAGGEGNGQPRI